MLKAVNSETLSVTVEQERPKNEAGFERMPVVEQFLARYLQVLKPREVIATIERSGLPRWRELRFGQYWLYARQPMHLAVSLKSGGYAVFEARGQLGRRLFGLPPGFGVGALGALVAIAAILAIAREARPLRVLAERVAGFTGDKLPVPVPPAGAPEIRKLIEAVNAMQGRIVDLVKGRTLLLGAISHDLKTYITRLRLRVEQLPADDQRDKAVRDLDDITSLLDDALATARGTSVSARREPVDLRELLAGLVDDYPDRAIRFCTSADAETTYMEGEPVALRRLFANLTDNAMRFGTRCEITLARCGEHLRVTVDDDGPGIPARRARGCARALLPAGALAQPGHRRQRSRPRHRQADRGGPRRVGRHRRFARGGDACHDPPPGPLPLPQIELAVDGVGEAHQLLAAEPAGNRVGERAVDPIEGAEAVALGKMESRVVEPRLLAHVERETPAGAVLVHELGRRQAAIRQQASAHQLPAETRQRRRAHIGADALGQPLHEMGLIGRAHLHGMAHLRHIHAVRADRGGDERGLRPARVHRETAHEVAAGSGQGRDQDDRCQRTPTGVPGRRAWRSRAPVSAPAPFASSPARADRARPHSAAR